MTSACSPGLSILLKVNIDGILGGYITGQWKQGAYCNPSEVVCFLIGYDKALKVSGLGFWAVDFLALLLCGLGMLITA